MLYAKQRNPEYQENDLFWLVKNKATGRYELELNDDAYANEFILNGNQHFYGVYTRAYNKVQKLDDLWYEWESYRSYGFGSKTEFIEWYCSRDDDKHYSKREIHVWISLLDDWTEDDEHIIAALELITRKKWRAITLRGNCQSDWQEGYASEELTDDDIDYIEMCYFNTGMEFLIYESEEDFDNDEDCYSIYVSDLDDLRERLGVPVTVYEWNGYIKTPSYSDPVVL